VFFRIKKSSYETQPPCTDETLPESFSDDFQLAIQMTAEF
jgi:hypothetical protein